MVEMAQYRFMDPASGEERAIIQPRLIAKTVLIERGIIRNESSATQIIAPADAEVGEPRPPLSRDTSLAQQQWRAFADRFLADVRLDDPGQPPPRPRGINWMHLPLPGPSGLTLWRSKGEGMVGAFITWRDSEGLALYEQLSEDREAIDREFAAAGLAPPEWTSSGSEASIMLKWSSPWPWDDAEEQRQLILLSKATNQFVNSLRPRLNRISHG